jgi:NodT family efflux transporter outer membrane factor (OMF) lipoprotein
MKRLLLSLACAAPLLAACAGLGGPDPRQADVRTPASFTAAGGQQIPDGALDRWWTLYNDPQLTQLVEAGVAANTDVRAALARLEEARAARASAIRSLGPRGDINGSFEVRQTEGLGDDEDGGGGGGGPQFGQITGRSENGNLGISGSQQIDIFGRNRQARRTLNAELLASRFAAESVRAAVAAQIADSLFLARGTAVQLEDARETLRIANELSRITRIRAERGLSPSSEFDRAETERANAEAEVARLEAAIRALQRALLALVGQGEADVSAAPVQAALYDPPATPDAIPGQLLVRRADVREAATRIESAAGNLQRARLALLPTFNFTPGIGLSRSSSDFFTANNGFWSLGASLLVPVLDRPRLLAEIQVSGARAEQAVIAYERAVQTAVSEADQALTSLAGDRARVAQLTTAEARARSAYEAQQRGFQAGLTDLTTLLDAERAYRGARSALSGARTQALQRSVQAFRALGGGWDPDLLNTTPPTANLAARTTPAAGASLQGSSQ